MFDKKYRPKTFDEFVGNNEVVNAVFEIFNSGQYPTAFFLSGSSGVGKTTLARLMAKELGADDSYIHEYNVGNTRGIDTIRDVIDLAKYKPLMGDAKVFIFDEAHALTVDAQNALLKIVEDAPKSVHFIFCTTHPGKILETIKTRCVRYELKPLSYNDGIKLVDRIVVGEKLQYREELKTLILKHSNGIPRNIAVNIFRCKGLEYKEAKVILVGTVEGVKDEVIELCRMFTKPSTLTWVALMNKVDNLLKEESAEAVRRMMFVYFSTVLRKAKTNKEVVYWTQVLEILDCQIENSAQGVHGLVYLLGRIMSGLVSH